MNNSMNFLKRLMALLLAMLLVTTMMGDDFASRADEEVVTEASVEADAPATDGPVADAGSADVTTDTVVASEESQTVQEETSGEGGQSFSDQGADENGQQINYEEGTSGDNTSSEEDSADGNKDATDQDQVVGGDGNDSQPAAEDETNKGTEREIDDTDKTTEEETELEDEVEEDSEEEEECQHQWAYSENGDGSHTVTCSKCGESYAESCTFEGRSCVKCGYTKECEHKWTYASNGDGTHTKTCSECDESTVEACEYDEYGVCIHCGYEDNSLTYQEFSKTIGSITVTVSGQMPRNSTVYVYRTPVALTDVIVNQNIDDGQFTSFESFDITVYDRHGNKYQPVDDGNVLTVTFFIVTPWLYSQYRKRVDLRQPLFVPRKCFYSSLSHRSIGFRIYMSMP